MSQRNRRKKEKRKEVKLVDLDFVKKKLVTLQQGNRFREAIVYAYYNYLQEAQGFYNMSRHPSQTAREFAMDLVKNAKLPPAILYSFTNLFEEARFGRHEIDSNKYSEALQLFLNLHELLGGSKKGGPIHPDTEQ